MLSGRPRLDAGKLRLLHRRLHRQRRHHLVGRRRNMLDREPARLHAALHDRGRRPAGRAQEDIRRRCLDDASAAGTNRCGPNPSRPAAADVHRRRPDRLQSLLAAGAPDERRRDRDVQDLFRAACSRRGGTGMVLELLRPQGPQAVGADGRGHHGGGEIRVRPRDAVRHPRTACSAKTTSCLASSAS